MWKILVVGSLSSRSAGMVFEITLSQLERAIAEAELKVFARIDHAEAARQSSMEMPPTMVLIYGSPRGGTPVMLAHPDAALDLPLKLLVREKPNGTTSVVFRPITSALAASSVPADQALKLAPAQRLVSVTIGRGLPGRSS